MECQITNYPRTYPREYSSTGYLVYPYFLGGGVLSVDLHLKLTRQRPRPRWVEARTRGHCSRSVTSGTDALLSLLRLHSGTVVIARPVGRGVDCLVETKSQGTPQTMRNSGRCSSKPARWFARDSEH